MSRRSRPYNGYAEKEARRNRQYNAYRKSTAGKLTDLSLTLDIRIQLCDVLLILFIAQLLVYLSGR
jgi:hypothetical protein